MTAALVLTMAPDVRTARLLARNLVRKKLAACVSFGSGFTSVYRWKGRLESARETLLVIKIPRANFSKVKKALGAAHPYELPEIICLPISGGSKEYLSWLNSCGV
jgi:periplasmic divalent cation tolerance protein